MIKEIDYQTQAVGELVAKTIKLLDAFGQRRRLVFKAPTGAGKTVMASRMLGMLHSQLSDEGREVAVIWIAPNKLHEQSYLKMKSFFAESCVLRPVVYDELDHSAAGYIHQGEVLFVNWESINKDNNLMVRDTEAQASLYDIVERTQKEHSMPLIVVIDEEHMFGGREAKKSEKVLARLNPKVEIRISATPISVADQMVSIDRRDVIKEEMIKDGITINPQIDGQSHAGLSENEFLLEQALARRNEIARAYKRQGRQINPLLLIQLPNDTSEKMDADDLSVAEMVKTRLRLCHGISTDNGRLAVWLSGDKQWLDNIEALDSPVEALLFKQAIALGWDCPRAAVLLIYRDIQSTTFGVQTVGRIMRMPEQRYYTDALLNHGWVYTNLSRDRIEIVAEDMNYISKALVARRRTGLQNVRLDSWYSERLSADRNRLGPDFYGVMVETFCRRWFHVPFQESWTSPFEDDNPSPIVIDAQHNRQQAERLIGIDFGHHDVTTLMVSDVELTDEVGVNIVSEGHRRHYARTHDELEQEMLRFCAQMIKDFERRCAQTLKGCLYQMLEEYLDIFETEAPNVILFYANRRKFEETVMIAIDKYRQILRQRQQEAERRAMRQYEWEVPEERAYAEQSHAPRPDMQIHAMLPFVRNNDASMPEDLFEAYLEEHKDKVDWWYKNGDNGKQHYAIPYTRSDGAEALFYVDFVVRMKSGLIYLFDTKTKASDADSPEKHNALIDYMATRNAEGQKMAGGVIIEDHGLWKYSPMKIADTSNLSGWRVLNEEI